MAIFSAWQLRRNDANSKDDDDNHNEEAPLLLVRHARRGIGNVHTDADSVVAMLKYNDVTGDIATDHDSDTEDYDDLPIFVNEKRRQKNERRRQRMHLVVICLLAIVTFIGLNHMSSLLISDNDDSPEKASSTEVSPFLQRFSFSDIPLLGRSHNSKKNKNNNKKKKKQHEHKHEQKKKKSSSHHHGGSSNHKHEEEQHKKKHYHSTNEHKHNNNKKESGSHQSHSTHEQQKLHTKKQEQQHHHDSGSKNDGHSDSNHKDHHLSSSSHNQDHQHHDGKQRSKGDNREGDNRNNNRNHDQHGHEGEKSSKESRHNNNNNNNSSSGDNRNGRSNNRESNTNNSNKDSDDDVQCAGSDWKCWKHKYASKYGYDDSDDSYDTGSNDQDEKQHDKVNKTPKNDSSSGKDTGKKNTTGQSSSTSQSSSEDDQTVESQQWTKPNCEPDDWKCWVNVYKDQASDGSSDGTSVEDGSSKGKHNKKSVDEDSSYQTSDDSSTSSISNDSDSDDSNHDSDDKKSSDDSSKDADSCTDGSYTERTLKLAYELPFTALFRDLKGRKQFEASSVTVVDDVAYAIDDASWSISVFDPFLEPFGEYNHLVTDPDRRKVEDSGFEAIFSDNSTFYVIRESIRDENNTYHAVIEELLLDVDIDSEDASYSLFHSCPTEFEFEGDSKGFEGALPLHDKNGDLIVLGLCEGNHCSESSKLQRDKGNGKLVAMKEAALPDGECVWKTIRVINIPSSAYFGDYSSIAMDDDGRVAISSQEESQLWVGFLEGYIGDDLWDIDAVEFKADNYTVYDFPKNDQCETVYCNIEGITWLEDNMILTVSDKMKGNGKQPFQCREKDQTSHVFVLP
jgi:hypothetical protein